MGCAPSDRHAVCAPSCVCRGGVVRGRLCLIAFARKVRAIREKWRSVAVILEILRSGRIERTIDGVRVAHLHMSARIQG